MMATDEKFVDRKRNRDKDYSHTAKRSDLEDEVRKIFPRNGGLETRQRPTIWRRHFPMQPFFSARCRTARKLSEMPIRTRPNRTAHARHRLRWFRFLERLANLRISCRSVSSDRLDTGRNRARRRRSGGTSTNASRFGCCAETLDLDPNARVSREFQRKRKRNSMLLARTGGAAYGTQRLRDALGTRLSWNLDPDAGKARSNCGGADRFGDVHAIRKGSHEIGLNAADRRSSARCGR